VLSLPAWGQAVTFADLEGVVVEESVVYERIGQMDSQKKSYKLQIDRKIAIHAGDKLDDTEVDTNFGPRGPHAETASRSWTLGQPREVQGLRFGGPGHKVWTFSNGTLSLLRTFPTGGYTTHISFTRAAAGLSCTVRAPLARELGSADLGVRESGGHEFHILSSKEISSSCRVTK
jgi:hypothetical protein